jgi:hypothetical protein
MIRNNTFLAVLMFLATGAYSQASVSGTVTYDNSAQTPMASITGTTTVYLKQGTAVMYQTTTNPFGNYSFPNVAPGTYTLKAGCNKPWGGANAGGSLMILLNFVGIILFPSSLYNQAGDVNGSGGIPASADELAISRRFVGMIPNFMPPNVPSPGGPDWYSQTFSVVVTNTNIMQNIKMLCAGDELGLYIPAP